MNLIIPTTTNPRFNFLDTPRLLLTNLTNLNPKSQTSTKPLINLISSQQVPSIKTTVKTWPDAGVPIRFAASQRKTCLQHATPRLVECTSLYCHHGNSLIFTIIYVEERDILIEFPLHLVYRETFKLNIFFLIYLKTFFITTIYIVI